MEHLINLKCYQRVFWVSVLLILTNTSPAMANNTPGPNVVMAELATLLLLFGGAFIGGFYSIIQQQHGIKIPNWLKVFFGIIAAFYSFIYEYGAMVVTIILCSIAIKRAIQMLYWGGYACWKHPRPQYLKNASPWRLVFAGIVIMYSMLSFVFISMGSQSYHISYRERYLKRVVTTHLACAQIAPTEMPFQELMKSPQCQHLKVLSPDVLDRYNIRIKYEGMGPNFTIYMPPRAVPFFPYNYLSSFPTYQADETGQIRMIRVHHKNELCPADAPVVMEVTSEDIEKMRKEILNQKESS